MFITEGDFCPSHSSSYVIFYSHFCLLVVFGVHRFASLVFLSLHPNLYCFLLLVIFFNLTQDRGGL